MNMRTATVPQKWRCDICLTVFDTYEEAEVHERGCDAAPKETTTVLLAHQTGEKQNQTEEDGEKQKSQREGSVMQEGANKNGSNAIPSTPQKTLSSININSQQATSIELALSLLESFPDEALTPYLERLECITHDAREANRLGNAPIYDAVLSNDVLLGKILEFDGSLAFYHKHYYNIVGYESPLPYEWSDENKYLPSSALCCYSEMLKYYSGTTSNILVSKKWKSMVMGQDGWDQWKAQSERRVQKNVGIAVDAVQDVSLSWTARICAMAIANDTIGLKNAFRTPNDVNRGIGAALAEQWHEDEDGYSCCNDDFVPVPSVHPFYRLCQHGLVEEVDDEELLEDAYITSIAYCAALVGSIDAIVYLESLLGGPLWDQHFDQKGDGFLNSLVVNACYNPTLECIVESIATVFPGKFSTDSGGHDMLHWRHRGGNGNHLHLAAARGHTGLVKVLIEGGMNPNRRCERISNSSHRDYYDCYDSDESSDDSDESSDDSDGGDARDRGVKQYPLPENWASIRGHEAVAKLIHSYSRGSGITDGVKKGSVKRYNRERGFGFIEPDDGSKDVFVHISDVNSSIPLEDNESVEFTTKITGKGIQAVNVIKIDRRGKEVVGTTEWTNLY